MPGLWREVLDVALSGFRLIAYRRLSFVVCLVVVVRAWLVWFGVVDVNGVGGRVGASRGAERWC